MLYEYNFNEKIEASSHVPARWIRSEKIGCIALTTLARSW